MIDLTSVRRNFPALDTDWALFDNAGGSAPCRAVIERVTDHMSRRPVQLGASYDLSREASPAELSRDVIFRALRGHLVSRTSRFIG